MSKYSILLALFIIAWFVQADDAFHPEQLLDKPSPAPKFMKFTMTGNLFSCLAISNIMNGLTKITATSGGIFDRYWTAGDYTRLQNELTAYYNSFTGSEEVFSATLANGETAYIDNYGNVLTRRTTGTASVLGDSLDTTFASNSGYNLTFYAGRNTTAAGNPSTELVISTSDGNTYTIYDYDTTTPLTLDMDGDGKLEASRGQWLPHNLVSRDGLVAFDMNGDGFDELVEWVGPNDGLLLTYHAGEKVTGKNLFGFAMGYTDGFEQLSTLDANKDSKITGQELQNLSVWQDANQNAIVDSGEVQSVQDLGITELRVTHAEYMSSFVQNGKNRVMWDWHPVMMMVKKNKR